jgi:hypothetical protein
VNLEADVLVKLAVARMDEKAAGVVTGDPEFALTESWLVTNGY